MDPSRTVADIRMTDAKNPVVTFDCRSRFSFESQLVTTTGDSNAMLAVRHIVHVVFKSVNRSTVSVIFSVMLMAVTDVEVSPSAEHHWDKTNDGRVFPEQKMPLWYAKSRKSECWRCCLIHSTATAVVQNVAMLQAHNHSRKQTTLQQFELLDTARGPSEFGCFV